MTIYFRSRGIWVQLENQKTPNSGFSFVAYPNTTPVGQYVVICSQYMYFIITLSHRGLMTIYFRSRGIWVHHVPQKLEKNQKTPNSRFSFVAYLNTLLVWSYVVICSQYTYCIIILSHIGLMTIYFRSQGIWVHHVPRKLENQKTPNSGFSIVAHPNTLLVG